MSSSSARLLKDYQPTAYAINTVDLLFELDENNTRITNKMQIQARGQSLPPLVLAGEHLTLLMVKINQRELTAEQYQLSENSLTLQPSEANFELEIVTAVNPAANTALEGLYKSGNAFCTQCEAEGFRRITYYLDRPDVMAIFTTTIIADKTAFPYLLSNGNAVSRTTLANNKHQVTWHDPHKKPCYLFALVAGDFDVLRDSYTTIEQRQVALEIYVDKGNLAKAEHAMQSLKKSMAWDEQRFGLAYDLDVYMVVAVSFFNMGAMENKGLNIFNDKYVLADQASATDDDFFNIEAVIAHEYFHNWTGNRVTCRDWFQLSLKEGLTVFRDQEFSADMHSAAVNRIKNVSTLRAHQFAEDAGPMAHPIRPEKVKEMNNFYTFTVYEKGAEVIRMLQTLLGRDGFRQGMDCYFQRHDGQAVTCDDFVNAMQAATGRDLTQFKRWYSQSGTPIVTLSSKFDQTKQQLVVTLEQAEQTTSGQRIDCLLIPFGIEIISEHGHQQHLLELTESQQSWQFNVADPKAIIAPLTDFSAPVKLNYALTVPEQLRIVAEANNAFCRWDALQSCFHQQIVNAVKLPQQPFDPDLVNAIRSVIASTDDHAFLALMLKTPSFSEVSERTPGLDSGAVVQAIDGLKRFLANALYQPLQQLYTQLSASPVLQDDQGAGKRACRNQCLALLAIAEQSTTQGEQRLCDHYASAQSMTDSLAALSAAGQAASDCFDTLMLKFESQWQDNHLVMDKWFSLQANWQGDDMFNRLENLLTHRLFTLNNPNRARSLIAAFSVLNARHFHADSGQGYAFLLAQLLKLDDINPQVASRLVTPLIQYQSLDSTRQARIKDALRQLAAKPNLSQDLEEKITAALKTDN